MNLPVENPRKYGSFDDITEEEANDIDSILTGGKSLGRVRHGSVSQSSDAGEVDEGFFNAARNSTAKYGG